MNTQTQRLRIYFTGVGGQGTLTATSLLAAAALEAGVEAVAGEVHGMAQRGGVVESVLLLGGWRAPRLDAGEADILLGFEPLETLRGLPYLRPGGAVFSSSDALPPLSVSLGQASYPSLAEIEAKAREAAAVCRFLPCRELGVQAGAVQSGNTVLLGALCASGLLPFGAEALRAAIRNYLPGKLQTVNLKALELGLA
ncbi:MAG: 2-oxoacid:acceptor oxidoreductase family protein [Desulfovibrio sp.]|nr:2-oxoacid:acceptor oxidoreductase family protein [Desulfovibrio sp.]